ncbi:MAG: iron-sulfur cluster biosynthesis transcriptional regulator SufR [Synechococcales cyanobacterium K44_A2020_017]|nr:iron-sulfur cluster biosynthesis transcriptional regulator SufR [Synechococcales cyanobacterium K32_A2020_035]MBF2095132.1 iron-sulfur cluster biosynthesis transcriptional regulator SufR [Synechococcales cyanobacterium K44_A2020_017]
MMATKQHPSTKQDILYYLLKQGQAKAQDLADALNISPQAIRRHLKDLEDEGLIQHHPEQTGMGRPQHIYGLSQEGRDRLPAQYDDFALSLLDTLTETVGREQVGTILRKQWERKAQEYRDRVGNGSVEERVANLVKLRQAEGYMAEWYSVEPEDESVPDVAHQDQDDTPAEQYVITEYNCAISHIAESFPSVCGHELEMFEIALEGCAVKRTHWLVNGEHRCGYLIRSTSDRPSQHH